MSPELDKDPEHQFLERLAAQLRGPITLSDKVEHNVMERIGEEPALPLNHPSRVRRPILALALAAGIAAIFALGVLVGRRSILEPGVSPELQSVEFVLRTAADSTVALVGDFNDWDPRATPLRPDSDSLWSVVVPLRPGRYRYTFVVDGTQWRRDPSAPRALEDDFGTPTSVITVAQR
jgi:hypothetical protein